MDNLDWCNADVSQEDWKNVNIEFIKTEVSSDMVEGDTIVKEIKPISVKNMEGSCFIDMGINYTGWVEIKFVGEQINQKVIIKTSDKETEDISFNQMSNFIITKSESVFCNKFNYFAGRYIIIEGINKPLEIDNIKGLILSNKLDKTADFVSSQELINQIYNADIDTFIANTLNGVTVDCPHRERLGYGEAGISTLWGIGLHAFDTNAFYRQMFQNWRDCQSANGYLPHVAPNFNGGGGITWSCFLTISLYNYYRYTQNKSILQENFNALNHWANYLINNISGGILQRTPEESGDLCFLGDWATFEGDDYSYSINAHFFNNCVTAYIFKITAYIATILGDVSNTKIYENVHENMKKAINKLYFDNEKKIYLDGQQRYLAVALCSEIVYESEKEYVLKNFEQSLIEKQYFDGGSAGLVFIFKAAGEILKRPDLIYNILKRTECPSYGYFIKQAQNTWPEMWDMRYIYGGSRIHTCYTGVAGCITRYLIGIEPSENGMQVFNVSPFFPKDMDFMNSKNDYGFGYIKINWQREANNTISYNINIPENTTAKITAPIGWNINFNNNTYDYITLQSGCYFMSFNTNLF